MTNKQSVLTKKATIYKWINIATAYCFKLQNWFVFFEAKISNRSWWNRTQRQRWKQRSWKKKNTLIVNLLRFRDNPNEKDLDMSVEISKIYDHINKSFKKSLIDKISKRLKVKTKI